MELSSSQPGRQTQPGSVLSVSSRSSRTVRQAGPRRWGRSCRGLQAAARSTAALQRHARTCSTPPHVSATQLCTGTWRGGLQTDPRQPSLVRSVRYYQAVPGAGLQARLCLGAQVSAARRAACAGCGLGLVQQQVVTLIVPALIRTKNIRIVITLARHSLHHTPLCSLQWHFMQRYRVSV